MYIDDNERYPQSAQPPVRVSRLVTAIVVERRYRPHSVAPRRCTTRQQLSEPLSALICDEEAGYVV